MVRAHVTAGGRIHLGLIDLTGASGRRFGGVGAILDNPRIEVVSAAARNTAVVGLEFDTRLHSLALAAVQRFVDQTDAAPVEVRVVRPLPRHSGFGSGTATIMACLEAASVVSGIQLPEPQLFSLSQRGGASGTGVNGFRRGGWIIDAGQPREMPALPSGRLHPRKASLMVQRIAPPDWTIDLYLPPGGHSVSGQREDDLFRRGALQDTKHTFAALALVHHGIVPAILEGDLQRFSDAVNEYQKVGLKALEWEFQGQLVQEFADQIRPYYACVAMSSTGPLVVGFRDSSSAAPQPVSKARMVTTRVAQAGVQVQCRA